MLPVIPITVVTLICMAIAMKMRKPKVSFWLFWSGCIHVLLEGSWGLVGKEICTEKSEGNFTTAIFMDFNKYSVFTPHWWGHMEGTIYGHYDLRYISEHADAFIVFVCFAELLIMGPLCFLLAYAIEKRKTWRHPLQIILCLIQIYGTLVYFLLPFIDGTDKSIFTQDLVGQIIGVWVLNGIWIVVPGFMAWRSFTVIRDSMGEVDKKGLKGGKKD